jgi:hypothetical protein
MMEIEMLLDGEAVTLFQDTFPSGRAKCHMWMNELKNDLQGSFQVQTWGGSWSARCADKLPSKILMNGVMDPWSIRASCHHSEEITKAEIRL